MEFLKLVLDNTETFGVSIVSLLFGVLLVLMISGAITHDDESTAFEMTLIWAKRALIIVLISWLPIFGFALYALAWKLYGKDFAGRYIQEWISILWASAIDVSWRALPLIFLPLFLKFAIWRWVKPFISSQWRRWGVLQSGDAASDIRVEFNRIKAKVFNPRDYYASGKIFWGLNQSGSPVYTPEDEFTKTHTKSIGPSQTGKGVMLGVLLDQAIHKGWGAFFVDKKPDDFIPDIMRESVELNARGELLVLDLTGKLPGGYHPFKYGTARERRERVVKALGMRDTGTNADHYKQNAREALDLLMPYWTTGTLSHLKDLVESPPSSLTDRQRQLILMFGGNIKSPLNELIGLGTLEPAGDGFNVEEAFMASRVIYIRSDIQDTVVRKAETCLLDEMIQVVRNIRMPNYVLGVIDEARFSMTETLADSLATVLSKKLILTLAYQSVEDPLNLTDKTLNAKSIKNGIETNTQNTLGYRPNDNETAEWLSDLTGETQKTITKMEKVTRNAGGAEEWDGERTVGQQAENLIHTNQLFAMPPRVGVLIRPGIMASLLYTCWVPVQELKGLAAGQAPSPALQSTSSTPTLSHATAQAAAAPAITDVPDQAPEIELQGDDPFADDNDSSPSEVPAVNTDEDVTLTTDEVPESAETDFDASIYDDDDAHHGTSLSSDVPSLSAAQMAAIEAAGAQLTASKNKAKTKPHPTKPAQPTKPDLSQLNDIEGI